MARKRIPRLSPEQEAELDARLQRVRERLLEWEQRIEAEKQARERADARRRRLFPFFRST